MADGVRLPYRSNAFDVALNIAVLHHLSTAERRLKCIQETLRILKPGGRALFYAWAKEQKMGPRIGVATSSTLRMSWSRSI